MFFDLLRANQLITITALVSILVKSSYGNDAIIFDEEEDYFCSPKACSCNVKLIGDTSMAKITCPALPNIEVAILRRDFFYKLTKNDEIIMTLQTRALDDLPIWSEENFESVIDSPLPLTLEIVGTNLVSISSNFFAKMNINLEQRFSLKYNSKLHTLPAFLLSKKNNEQTSLQTVEISRNGIQRIESNAFKGILVTESFILWEPNAQIHPQAFDGVEIRGTFKIVGAKTFPSYLRNMSKVRTLVMEDFEFNELPEDAFPLSLQNLELRGKISSSSNMRLKIHINAFRGLTQLLFLALIDCNIAEIPDGVLQGLKLRELKLTSNHLQRISEKDLLTQKQLVTFDVSQNFITELPQVVVTSIFLRGVFPSLSLFNISQNLLTTLPNPEVASEHLLNETDKLFKLDLFKNPFICDCKMKWMEKSWVKNFITILKVSCSEPKEFGSLQEVLNKNALKKCNNLPAPATETPTSPKISSGRIRDDILVIVVTVVAVAITVFLFILCWKYRARICSHSSRATTKYRKGTILSSDRFKFGLYKLDHASKANGKEDNQLNDVEIDLEDRKSHLRT